MATVKSELIFLYLFLQKKLAILLRGGEKTVNTTTNGNHDETDANGVNGEENGEVIHTNATRSGLKGL